MTNERRLQTYDQLRRMHSILKAIYWADDYKAVADVDEDNAINALEAVLYMAEGVFARQDA